MKKIWKIVVIVIAFLCITGCNKNNEKLIAENLEKIDLTGDLVTYEAYYHNVVEYEQEKGTGITHILEKDRKMFIEYTGTIKLGIDMSKVDVKVKGKEIDVYIPKATIIGEPNIDKDTFKKENFIQSKDGINKNKITADDAEEAFRKAQNNIKKEAMENDKILALAQKRAKVILENNIKAVINLNSSQYEINWEYGQ